MDPQRDHINEVARRSLMLAREYSEENSWGRSVAHYFVVFEVCPQLTPSLLREFTISMTNWSAQLVAKNKHEEFFLCCEQTLSIYPRSCPILFELGRHLISMGLYMQACGFLQKALISDSSFSPAETYLNVAKDLLVNRWHYRMLNSNRRNLTYKQAIQESISAQDFVLDIGCGSGLLSLYAAETKADIVACESNEAMISIATEVFKKSDANVVLIGKNSKKLDLNEVGGLKFSIIITEIFDAGLFGEGALQSLIDAWERLLLPPPKGKVLPHSAVLYMSGIESETLARKFRVVYSKHNKLFTHINFSNINIFNDSKEPYDTEDLSLISDIKYVTNAQVVLNVDFQDVEDLKYIFENIIEKNIKFKVTEKCKIDAYIMWFDLLLTENISLTTDPRNARRCTAWDTALFYRTFPLICDKNENITITVQFKKGIVCLIPNDDSNCCNIPVPKEVVRILNDSDYIDGMISAVSFACIHLVQLFTFEYIKVLDTCHFPIIGLLLLIRGVRFLSCTHHGIKLIRKLSEYNNFNLKNIKFLKNFTHDSNRYEIIVNSVIDFSGLINFKQLITSEIFKTQKLRDGGMLIPSNLKMVGRLVNSEYLNNFNRVYDHNLTDFMNYQRKTQDAFKAEILRDLKCSTSLKILSNDSNNCDVPVDFFPISKQFTTKYTDESTSRDEDACNKFMHKNESITYEIANIINTYQVSYNTHQPSILFKKIYLTDEFTIFEQCLPDCEHITIDTVATEDGKIDAIQVYYKIEVIRDTDEISTDRNNSFINTSYFLIDPPMSVTRGEKLTVLVFCNTLEHFRMMVDREISEERNI